MTPYSNIEVRQPSSLGEALDWLAEAAGKGETLRPMAGCTDIMVDANYGRLQWQRFVELWSLRDELGGVRWSDDGLTLELGALATYADLLADERARSSLPQLCKASSLVGATQIQARGTFAGNIENASPAADAVPMLMALDARVRLQSVRGVRELPLDGYYSGYRQTQRDPDELITATVIPQPSVAPSGHFFRKVGTRAYQAVTKVGLSACLDWQQGAVAQARVVATAMGPTICRCPALEEALVGVHTLNTTTNERLRAAQTTDLTPITDLRSTATYRNEVFHRLVMAAVLETRPDNEVG